MWYVTAITVFGKQKCGCYREFSNKDNKPQYLKDLLIMYNGFNYGEYLKVKIRNTLYTNSDGFYHRRMSDDEINYIIIDLRYRLKIKI